MVLCFKQLLAVLAGTAFSFWTEPVYFFNAPHKIIPSQKEFPLMNKAWAMV